jgi:hydrogenase nickel incorporation protein HypA/HybF
MHEVSIAQSLLRQVHEAAERSGLATVESVGVCVGHHSGVVPDALAFAFEILREGPVTGGATLAVRTVEGHDLRLEWIEGESVCELKSSSAS